MAMHRREQSLALAIKGYAWLPDLRRRSHGQPVPMRLLGRPAVAIGGPAAARFFYESGGVERHDAIPGPVLDTLFGRGAVHTLDGRAHELRKALFLALLTGDGVATLTRLEYYLPPQDVTIDLARVPARVGGGPRIVVA